MSHFSTNKTFFHSVSICLKVVQQPCNQQQFEVELVIHIHLFVSYICVPLLNIQNSLVLFYLVRECFAELVNVYMLQTIQINCMIVNSYIVHSVYTRIWKKDFRGSKAPKTMLARNQLRVDRKQLIRIHHQNRLSSDSASR